MLMQTLLAIDPAADQPNSDTGWVLGTYGEGFPFVVSDSGIIPGGFDGFAESVYPEEEMYNMLQGVNTVVCEDYIVFNKFGDPSPLKIIGLVQYLRPDVVLQPASGKNSVVPDAFLKTKGLWGTKGSGAGKHRDRVEAIRHAYYWLARTRHRATLEELAPKE